MRSGGWKPAIRCPWPPAGAGRSTSAAAPSSGRRFSPRGARGEAPPDAARAELRLAFGRWGRPERLWDDNGAPWGSSGDLPTDLAMWPIGLGIGMTWNPPRSPQSNGVVERSRGTAKRWAEPGTCSSPAELQGRLGRMDGVRREAYPSVGGRSRLDAFPASAHSGRGYTPEWEESRRDLKAVHEHPSGYAVSRRVDVSGKSSVCNIY